MSNSLIEQLSKKLGVYDEENIKEKTTELIRLLELKSTAQVQQVGEYAKIVLCIDLAAKLLDVGIDNENALKVSGLKKSQYLNNKRMFEKILDLNKPLNINEICVQLGAQEVVKKANDLLEFYKNCSVDATCDEDMAHPQYSSMAVFQAGKLLKVKIPKSKVITYSHLKPMQWTNLEKKWDKLIEANPKLKNDITTKKTASADNDEQEVVHKKEVKKTRVDIEPYNNWKERMLKIANDKLRE